MAIKLGEKDLFPYLGDYRPVNIYKGEHKVAGWKWAEQSGEELHFENTYNDFVEVEIDGKSYQEGEPSPDNPSEIHSLNDVDVVSNVGDRNLIRRVGEVEGYQDASGTTRYNRNVRLSEHFIDVESNTDYIASNSSDLDDIWRLSWFDKNEQQVSYVQGDSRSNSFNPIFKSPNNASKLRISYPNAKEVKLEKGTKVTDWTPSPEDITESDNHPLIDKINLLLSEPLRSVGDVKDRLFRDSDGLWKVERNVELIYPEDGTRTVEETYDMLESPIYEQLSQEYQDKLNNLRSLRDSNYVYTVVENLKPTLHARLKVKDI